MKKFLALLLAITLILTLAACSKKVEPTEPTSGEVDRSQVEAMANFHPDFDLEQAQAMCNATLNGMMLVEDGICYGRMFVKGTDYWQFAKMELIPDPENDKYITSGEWSILDKDVVPNFINKVGDTLYYIAEDWTKGDDPVYSLCSVGVDGKAQTKLADGTGGLTVRGDRLYFTDADYHYVSTDLTGGDKQVIIEKATYYPYFLDEDWLFYQDDADNESFHLYCISAEVDVKINDEAGYCPFLYGSCLYFCTPAAEPENAYNICRVDLADWTPETKDNKVIPVFNIEKSDKPCGGEIHISADGYLKGMNNANGTSMDAWKNFTDTGYEKANETYLFVSKAVDIYQDYAAKDNGEEYERIFVMNNETGYAQTILSLR